MAPKGKPAAAPGGAPGDEAPPVALKSNRFKWMVIRILTMLMSFAFIVLLVLYVRLLAKGRDPLEEHMIKLKDILATGYRDKLIMFDTHLRAAEEVAKVPAAVEEAENDFYQRKSKYQSLFKKNTRSTDAWQIFGRNLYYISKDKKTWHDAEDFCLSRGAHLASILSDQEQLFISTQLDQPAWIGLTDAKEEGSWKWTDGSRLTSQYWSPGSPVHPKDDGEAERDCTAMLDSSDEHNWNAANCSDFNGWVCKQMLNATR